MRDRCTRDIHIAFVGCRALDIAVEEEKEKARLCIVTTMWAQEKERRDAKANVTRRGSNAMRASIALIQAAAGTPPWERPQGALGSLTPHISSARQFLTPASTSTLDRSADAEPSPQPPPQQPRQEQGTEARRQDAKPTSATPPVTKPVAKPLDFKTSPTVVGSGMEVTTPLALHKQQKAWDWALEIHRFTYAQLITTLDPTGCGALGFETLYLAVSARPLLVEFFLRVALPSRSQLALKRDDQVQLAS